MKARAVFYRQLATMLDAGVSIRAALTTLGGQSRGRMQRAATAVLAGIEGGQTLTDAVRANAPLFSLLEIEMIAAGELSGRLGPALGSLADLFEFRKQTMGRMMAKLAYPIVLIHVALPVMSIPLIFAPGGGMSVFVRQVLLSFLQLYAFFGILWLVYQLFSRVEILGALVERLVLALPVVGGIWRRVIVARFARAFSSLYAAGVVIAEALEVATRVAASPYLRHRIMPRLTRVRGGEGITEVLADAGVFDVTVMSMIATGEETGKLDVTLGKVADHAEDEARNRINVASVLMAVFIYIVIAVLIGYFVIIRFWTSFYSNLPV